MILYFHVLYFHVLSGFYYSKLKTYEKLPHFHLNPLALKAQFSSP